MNSLRPFILRRDIMVCSSLVGNGLNESMIKPANFAWKYWIRGNGHYSNWWKHLRPHHQCTAGFQLQLQLQLQNQNSHHGDNGTSANYRSGMKYVGCSPRAIALPSSVLALPYTSHMTLMPVLYFSTMPHSTSASSNKENKQKEKENEGMESLPASQKIKVLLKKYGAVFVGTYFGIYVSTLLAFFVILDFGLLDPDTFSQIFRVSKNFACETADIIGPTGTGASMNEAANAYAEEVTTEISKDKRTLVDIITSYLRNWDLTSKYADKLSENPHLANLAVAWFMVKFTEPVRLAAAVIATPKVAKALGWKEVKAGAGKIQN